MCTLLRLLLCLALTAVASAVDLLPDEDPPEQYRTASGLTITFLTHAQGEDIYPAVFKAIELPGWYLHGYFSGCTAKHTPWIFVVVEDPSIYTMAYVNQVMTMLVELNTLSASPVHIRYPMDYGSAAWAEAGVLDHELSHADDSSPCYRGHLAAYIHRLFPETPCEPTGQPAQNPWQTIDLWWREADTHPGYNKRVYR